MHANKPAMGPGEHGGDFDTDVVVIGLGPTGLSMAHMLARRGVDVIVLEREPEFYGMARAVFTDDECLRIMQHIGMADELHAEMLSNLRVRWVAASGKVLGWFQDEAMPHGWPASNFFYQPTYETSLENGLRAFIAKPRGTGKVEVRRGRSVSSVEQDGLGVFVRHDESRGIGYGRTDEVVVEGNSETIRARYAIACDGGRSRVRGQLGIRMSGTRFPQRWLVVDLKALPGADPFADVEYFDFVCDPVLPTVSCPQPGGRHRFEFMLHDDDDTADFEKVERAHELIQRYIEPGTYEITRQLVYTFNALVADRWREERIFLAGDAAHMTPQFIGQGMNAGIRDADNLSWKIAEVLRQGAPDSLLDSYESERKPHAAAMIKLSVLNKDLVSTSRTSAKLARTVMMTVFDKTPVLNRVMHEVKVKPRPRLKNGQYFGLPRGVRGPLAVEGSLMPQPSVEAVSYVDGGSIGGAENGAANEAQSRSVSRFDDVVGNGWLVIGVDDGDGFDPRGAAQKFTDLGPDFTWVRMGREPLKTGVRTADSSADELDCGRPQLIDIVSCDKHWQQWLRQAGIRSGSLIIVRPDKFVFGVIASKTIEPNNNGAFEDVRARLSYPSEVVEHV